MVIAYTTIYTPLLSSERKPNVHSGVWGGGNRNAPERNRAMLVIRRTDTGGLRVSDGRRTDTPPTVDQARRVVTGWG